MRRANLGVRIPRQVPIHLAALNDSMLRLAGEMGDGAALNFVSPAQVKRSVKIMKDARAAAEVTTPFEVSIYFRATVTSEPELALPSHQQELLTYVLAPVYQKFFAQDGYEALCAGTARLWVAGERETALKGIPMRFIGERCLVGTPEHIARQLGAYAEAGMDTALIMPVPIPGTDYLESCQAMIEALGSGRRRPRVHRVERRASGPLTGELIYRVSYRRMPVPHRWMHGGNHSVDCSRTGPVIAGGTRRTPC